VARSELLFIGIPTWNSERFLGICLQSVLEKTRGISKRIAIMDNGSDDDTVAIARKYGAEAYVRPCSMPDALNRLVQLSDSAFTLFIHADTVLLNDNWFELCTARLTGATALISPQDIGCGPYTRPWGKDKPESSFMLFRTPMLKRLRKVRWVRHFRLPWPQQVVDFYTSNVTHKIPDLLSVKGMRWESMSVHTSRRVDIPIWRPRFEPVCWSEELAHLEYGLGNFYSVDGEVTHYHNWFERLLEEVPDDSEKADLSNGGIPSAYINAYTRRFLTDYARGAVGIPDTAEYPERSPAAIPVREVSG